MNFIFASLTSRTGKRSALSFAMALSLWTPVVVSSLAAFTFLRTSFLEVCTIAMRSAPSSMMKSGAMFRTVLRLL